MLQIYNLFLISKNVFDIFTNDNTKGNKKYRAPEE